MTAFTLNPDRLVEMKRTYGERWFNYAALLDEVAFEIKPEFLDEISRLGLEQKNRLLWWSSKLASKNPHQSDLFLLTCYAVLISRLQKTGLEIWCLVEDPWLYRTLWENLGQSEAFRFHGLLSASRRLWQSKAIFSFKKLLIPLALIIKEFYRLTLIKMRFRPWVLAADGLIYAKVEKRCFQAEGEFADQYLGNLCQILEGMGKRLIRLADPVFPLALRDPVASNRLVPLESYGAFRDLFLSLPYIFKIPGKDAVKVGSLNLGGLMERAERDENASTAIRKLYLIHQMFRRLGQALQGVQFFVYPFENQPWEKVMLLGLQSGSDLILIGHQHSTLPELILNYYLGKYEKDTVPLPDWIACSSSRHVEVLKSNFSPRARIANVGALRHGRKPEASSQRDSRKIAVFLPINRRIATLMVNSLSAVGSSNYLYLVKSHPALPLNGLGQAPHIQLTSQSAGVMFNECAAVVYASTACGVQAAEKGLPVFLFRNEYLESYAGGRAFHPVIFFDFRDLETKLGEISDSPPEFLYFSPIDPDIWGEILTLKTPSSFK